MIWGRGAFWRCWRRTEMRCFNPVTCFYLFQHRAASFPLKHSVLVKTKLRPAAGLGPACALGRCVRKIAQRKYVTSLEWAFEYTQPRETSSKPGVCGIMWVTTWQATHFSAGGFPLLWVWPCVLSTDHPSVRRAPRIPREAGGTCLSPAATVRTLASHRVWLWSASPLPNLPNSWKRNGFTKTFTLLDTCCWLSFSNQCYMCGCCVYLVSKHNGVFFHCVLMQHVYTNCFTSYIKSCCIDWQRCSCLAKMPE